MLIDGATVDLEQENRRLRAELHAQSKAPPDSELAGMLETAIGELSTGIRELRELARGIHPAVLTQRGLETALESLAGRAPLPVDLRATLDGRRFVRGG